MSLFTIYEWISFGEIKMNSLLYSFKNTDGEQLV